MIQRQRPYRYTMSRVRGTQAYDDDQFVPTRARQKVSARFTRPARHLANRPGGAASFRTSAACVTCIPPPCIPIVEGSHGGQSYISSPNLHGAPQVCRLLSRCFEVEAVDKLLKEIDVDPWWLAVALRHGMWAGRDQAGSQLTILYSATQYQCLT